VIRSSARIRKAISWT